MFYYFHEYDNYFHHYYRLEADDVKKLYGKQVGVLHVNGTSPLIGTCLKVMSPLNEEITCDEFNEVLNKVLEKLGIQIKRFNFV